MRGNRELVSQALANLVDNAIKYAAPRRRRHAARRTAAQPEIVVKAAGEGDRILLTVADRGPGIPEADRGACGGAVRAAGAEPLAAGLGPGPEPGAAVARLHGGELRLEDNQPGLRIDARRCRARGPAASGARGMVPTT